MQQELNMKIKKTPLGNAIEELDSLLFDQADLKEKIEQQREKVKRTMEETKQYKIRCGGWEYSYALIEEQRKIARKKI